MSIIVFLLHILFIGGVFGAGYVLGVLREKKAQLEGRDKSLELRDENLE